MTKLWKITVSAAILPAVAFAALCLNGCGPDCGPFLSPELISVDASMTTVNAAETQPVASDLRLNVSLGTRMVAQIPVSLPFIDTAYACSPAPTSLKDNIRTFSLTCDKPIRGFEAGENILTSGAKVFFGQPDYNNTETSTTLLQWLDGLNNGTGYDFDTDVAIAFIPVGTVVPAGEYTFRLVVETVLGSRYETDFTPVAL